jgi:AAA+ superfamily predicted ATPase
MIRERSRRQYPSIFLLKATTEQAMQLERMVRYLFENKMIKDFAFQPVIFTAPADLARFLASKDDG